jgi:hypothetical protein
MFEESKQLPERVGRPPITILRREYPIGCVNLTSFITAQVLTPDGGADRSPVTLGIAEVSSCRAPDAGPPADVSARLDCK